MPAEQTNPWQNTIAKKMPKVPPLDIITLPSEFTAIAVVII